MSCCPSTSGKKTGSESVKEMAAEAGGPGRAGEGEEDCGLPRLESASSTRRVRAEEEEEEAGGGNTGGASLESWKRRDT